MNRDKSPMIFGRCEHPLPVLVEETEMGGEKSRVAHCLRCGQSGPTVLGGAEEALHALRDQVPWRREAQSA